MTKVVYEIDRWPINWPAVKAAFQRKIRPSEYQREFESRPNIQTLTVHIKSTSPYMPQKYGRGTFTRDENGVYIPRGPMVHVGVNYSPQTDRE